MSAWLKTPASSVWLAIALGLLVAVPGVGLGFMSDDYSQLLVLRDDPSWFPPLFEFYDGDPAHLRAAQASGPTPWFAHPHLKQSFWRPLSAALARLDQLCFGVNAVGHHVHSVIWYLLLIGVWSRLLLRLLPPPLAAWSAIVFALDENHWHSVNWIAGRSALVAATFGCLGLAAHLDWREHRRTLAGWLAPLGFAIALLSSESGLGVIAYAFAYELCGTRDRWRTRATAILPTLCVVALWFTAYSSGGHGAYGSDSYLDPLHDPLAFLTALPARALALLGMEVAGSPGDLWYFLPSQRPFMVGAGVLAVVMLWITLPAALDTLGDARRHVRWLLMGAIISVLPVIGGLMSGRLLLNPSLGGSVALGLVAHVGWEVWRKQAKTSRQDRLRWLVAFGVILAQLWLAWIPWIVQTILYQRGLDRLHAVFEHTSFADQREGERWIMVTTPGPEEAQHLVRHREIFGLTHPQSVWPLSLAPRAHRVRRVSSHTLELEVQGGTMLETEYERHVRSSRLTFEPGAQVTLPHMTATVVHTQDGCPDRVRFTFDRALEDPSFRFLVSSPTGFATLTLPAIGETKSLDYFKSPAAL